MTPEKQTPDFCSCIDFERLFQLSATLKGKSTKIGQTQQSSQSCSQ